MLLDVAWLVWLLRTAITPTTSAREITTVIVDAVPACRHSPRKQIA